MRKMAAEEDEPGIPRAALNRVIRETLPNARMSNDFRDVLHLCCMQFIKHVGAEANRLCMNDQKKTINKDHLFRAVQNLGFGPDYLDAGRSVLDLCDEEASRRLKRQNSRLEKCGIPEEELLKLQQQLFDKARTEQASANQLQTAWFQQQWQESMRQKQLMPPPPLPPPSVSKMNHKIWEMQNNNDADDDYDAA
ncbi:hypothetical protein D917_03400 [Trichinella nativa]|uniref:Protein Dr1 n=1 Tax=Trichinella nativa TaxID=6335 RepID=A0A1Y3ECN7_9BILA|nr:hypothetical protein D917_03400 [Trichinella nativa]